MSYFKALQRAAEGLSEAKPRPLSRYELPEAAWEVEADPLGPDDAGPDLAPQFAATRGTPSLAETATLSTPPSRATAGEQRDEHAQPVAAPPWAPQPAPVPAPHVTAAADPATTPAAPVRAAAEPLAPVPPSPPEMAAAGQRESPAPLLRELEIHAERLVRAEVQPIPPAPAAEDQPVSEPQVITLVPAPASAPEAKLAPPAPAHETPVPQPLIIEIGQIDIRLEASARGAPVPPAPRRQAPVLSLDEYLRARS